MEDPRGSAIATPPPNTPKKRRYSQDEGNDATGSKQTETEMQYNSIGSRVLDEFTMTQDEFLTHLYKFMHDRGQPITKVPSLGYQELDLYLLYRLVIARGGMDEVTRKQEWKLVYQDLGIPTMSTSASYNTRTNYKKYLYLYELEHCDFSDLNRPRDAVLKYKVGEFIRIVSSVFEGQVFYAKILKTRFKDGRYQYYVHYNGWNNSHDEWMREDVLDPLLPEERMNPESLPNPPPSRSSKSNHLIYDPSVSEKVIQNIISQKEGTKPIAKIAASHPLSPSSPAASNKKGRRPNYYGATENDNYPYPGSFDGMTTSEEEEAAAELLEMEYCQGSSSRSFAPVRQAQKYRASESISFPMRLDYIEDVSKLVEEKRNRPHDQDLIHRNRLHTHVVMGGTTMPEEDPKEREMMAKLLKTIKVQVEAEDLQDTNLTNSAPMAFLSLPKSDRKEAPVSKEALDDPRSLKDVQESLVNLQSSLLSLQSEYRKAMKTLKKHHNTTELPPLSPPRKSVILTRRSDRN